MASNVVYIADFSTDKITISQPKVLESGAKQAYLNYNGSKLTLQSATNLSVPFGLAVYDKGGPAEYSIELSFRGHDTNPEIGQFLEKMVALDKFMIQQAIVNSKAWFKKNEMSEEVAKEFYAPCVRYGKDADGNPKPYPPTIKINLKKNGDSFESKVFDDQKRTYEGVPLEDLLVKGALVTTLIQCTSIWFAGSKFGTSWKALQIRMDKVPDSIRDYAFVDDDAETAPVSQRKAAEFEDDADDDAFEAPAPAPAPAPVAKKPSAVAAVLPPTIDDGAEDHEPVPAPKKATITAKKVIGKVTTKK